MLGSSAQHGHGYQVLLFLSMPSNLCLWTVVGCSNVLHITRPQLAKNGELRPQVFLILSIGLLPARSVSQEVSVEILLLESTLGSSAQHGQGDLVLLFH